MKREEFSLDKKYAYISLLLVSIPGFVALLGVFLPLFREMVIGGAIFIIAVCLLVASAFFVMFLYMNRFFSRVWIDHKERKIVRKGFFGGFKKECPIDEIKSVKVVSLNHHAFLVIADNTEGDWEGTTKMSHIRVEYNRENLKKIRKIWSEPLVFISQIPAIEEE